MKFEWNFAPSNTSRPIEPSDPSRVLIVGSFSGVTSTVSQGLLKAHRVDLDTFETLFAKLLPEWSSPDLTPWNGPTSLTFDDLESFHPDSLIRRIPLLREILEAYTLLDTQPQSAIQRLHQLLPSDIQSSSINTPAESTPPISSASHPQTSPDSEADLMERLLGRPQTPSVVEPQKKASDVVQSLIQSILPSSKLPTSPSTSSAATLPSALSLKESTHRWLSNQLNIILHHPKFQQLERHWRGLDFLLRSLQTDSNIQIEVVDYPLESLQQSLDSGSIAENHPLIALLADPHKQGKVPYSILMATYPLCSPVSDLPWASFLTHLGATLRLPVLLSAHREWIHHLPLRDASTPPSDALKSWYHFQAQPASCYLAVSGPNFLLRHPYGKKSDPIEAFDYEENPHPVQHDHYLWGSSSWMTLKWILESYGEAEGWSFDLNHRFEASGLPIHTYKINDESTMTPCAETWWNDWEIMALCDQGVIPLAPIRGRDALFTPYFVSAHKPSHPLQGPWS